MTVGNVGPMENILAGTLFLTVNCRETWRKLLFQNYLLEDKAPSRNTCNKIGYPILLHVFACIACNHISNSYFQWKQRET
jgi:hypothetical protein